MRVLGRKAPSTMGLMNNRYVSGSGMCTQWSFQENVMGNSDHRRGCGVSMLTRPISLALDRCCLLLLTARRPATIKLICRLAF
jgi:hypothetical protein